MPNHVCKRLPNRDVHIDRIPRGTKIVACGKIYVADLPDGPAVVAWRGHAAIDAQSRLRRAVIRGQFAGVRRKRRRLGATSRKGPRTGAVEVNPAIVNDRVDQLLRTMQPCWSSKQGTYLQPVDDAIVDPVHVPDAGTGRLRRVDVAMAARVQAANTIGGGFLATENVDGRVRQTVVVTPNAAVCGKVPGWRRLFRDVLTHELAHASDPTLILEAKGHRQHVPTRPGSREYFNSPTEMLAHLAEVKDQLRRFGQEVDWSQSPAKILRTSDKFVDIEPYLTTANYRRFLKMAARLKEQVG